MDKEKKLIKSEEKNILIRIFKFIKKLCFKKQKVKLVEEVPCKPKDSFINKMKENRNLLNLQRHFENGEVKEDELTEQQKEELLNLYNNQISELQQDIKNYEKVLNSYKEKILEIKRKLRE